MRIAKKPRGIHSHPFDRHEVLSAIAEFQALLDTNAPEEQIHQLLAGHIEFWNGIVRLATYAPLYSKIPLGADYVIDFAHVDLGSAGAEWRLIEIEPPSHHLFTKNGRMTAHLTHAIQQVRDWQGWIAENLVTARKMFPGIDSPMGFVFIGRRSELASDDARSRLNRINIQHRSHIEVRTLDRFVSMAMDSLSFGSTTLPHHALTADDLRKRFPNEARKYVNSSFGRQRTFVEDRQYRQRFEEDFGPR